MVGPKPQTTLSSSSETAVAAQSCTQRKSRQAIEHAPSDPHILTNLYIIHSNTHMVLELV